MPRLLSLAFLVTAFGAARPHLAVADEPPKPLTGQVRLVGGRLVEYATHYNRNAIRASARLGEGLIIATRSGVLQRFDSLATGLARERVDVRGLACLARGEADSVFAGFDDGRVCRLDPQTLELTEVAKLPSEVVWVGWSKVERAGKPGGLLAATSRYETIKIDGEDQERRVSAIHDLASGKSFPLEYRPSAFLVDRAGRLWVGSDRGEWGGWVVRVDLPEGKVETLPPPPSSDPDREPFWDAVLGFVELADGQIWAFGGTSHMGRASGAITRVDRAEPRIVYAIESPKGIWDEAEPDPNRPVMPLTHVLEERGGLLIFSYSDVFRVDKALKSWRRVATLDLDYEWGRPDAVGAYPAISAVLPPTHEGEPYAIATSLNGVLLLDGAKTTSLAAPGQFGATGVTAIRQTSEGLLFLCDDGRAVAWRLGEKGWETLHLAPPYEIDPNGEAAPLEKDEEAWDETQVLVAPDGAILTISGTDVNAGTRTTARRVDGKSELLGRQTSTLEPGSCFITPDGNLWAATDYLRRFENGRWSTVARVLDSYVPRPLPVSTDGPPWLLLGRARERLWQFELGGLWRLDHDARGENPKLSEVSFKGHAVRMATPWPGGALLATNDGFHTYQIATGRLEKLKVDGLAENVTAMARDGLGRLWVGREDGLRLVVDIESGKSESLDPAPGVGRHRIDCLAADPARDDGVIAVINSEAVVFIRAEREP